MTDTVVTIGTILGGLGLFLLAVNMITEGLKLAAGDALSDILSQWTRTPMRGIAAGIMVTGLVQSSSAVTVATIGFVNAGLLTMTKALGVIFGANVGTTMTGWLVAAVGFEINLGLFALPMIGIGMFLRLTGANSRRGAIGWAVAGFGLFFVGIDVLKSAFEGWAAATELEQFHDDGFSGVMMFLGIGFLMTLLTQSSSAAIALVLTAATGGVVSLTAAAAMVIGANVGTTSTAALSVIGATPYAKRVAAAHIIFNVVTGVVAIAILPVMLWLVQASSSVLGMADIPAVTLALFHTIFNILGVLLIWPHTERLATLLKGYFRTTEEMAGKPKYLDKTVTGTPELAVKAINLELVHISEIVRSTGMGVLSAEQLTQRIAIDKHAVHQLVKTVEHYITQLEQGTLPREVADDLSHILRTTQYLSAAMELAAQITRAQARLKPINDEPLTDAINRHYSHVAALLVACDIQSETFQFENCEALMEVLHAEYQELKEQLLEAGAHLKINIRVMSHTEEQLSRVRRLAEQTFKATREITILFKSSGLDVGPIARDELFGGETPRQ